jgi:AcrR family transcriptional regulator
MNEHVRDECVTVVVDVGYRATTGQPRSRRERPAKAPLSRRGIVDAALVLLRQEGLGKVTMRRIAAALDTGAAALYVYVRDTEDLHAQILDALLAPVTAHRVRRGAWRKRLKVLVAAYAAVLLEHPDMARMAMSTQPSGPNYLALCEAILALLREGGVADREAAWAVDLLLLYPTAIAAERGASGESGHDSDRFAGIAAAIATADAAHYPNVARLGAEILSGPGRFDWALDVLLNGLLATPRPKKKAH